jgi:hypothetical protein
LFRLLIPSFEHLPNLDASSPSPSANRSLSVTFITPTPRRRISVPRYVSTFNLSATICTTHLPFKCNKGRPLDYDPCGHFLSGGGGGSGGYEH